MTIAYHFTGSTLRDGRPLPPVGEWLVHHGPVKMCESGLHASKHPLDALKYAPGAMPHLVEVEDVVEEQDDKLLCRKRKIIQSIDVEKLLREFARWCALQVIDIWDAPTVVRQYLETGDETIREAAQEAAQEAARAAAGAAWAAAGAAREAAWEAAWAALGAQRDQFAVMVNAAFSQEKPA